MKEPENLFPVTGYYGPDLFCDRDEESKRLIGNARNGLSTTIFALRRMGKTGLIQHTFYKLRNDKNIRCIYLDIYDTQDIRGFTNKLSSAILNTFPEKQSIGKKFIHFLKSLRPVISFDTLTGNPEVSVDFRNTREYESSIHGLFAFLEEQNINILLAIDEFQQIATYPEKSLEATLRSILQRSKNVHCIFSGSSRHLLAEMFHHPKRPFYASTATMEIGPIDGQIYAAFIQKIFARSLRKIDSQACEFILDFCQRHTFYVQFLCNKLYGCGQKRIDLEFARQTAKQILTESAPTFLQYRNLLTLQQWELLKAIAREGNVYQPTSKHFVQTYKLGTPAYVRKAMQSLMDKEMVCTQRDERGLYYRVYDCFLSRWLQYQS